MVEFQRVAKTFRAAGVTGIGDVKALPEVSYSIHQNE